ncbi:MAG: hypothetical protein JNK50_04430 [Bacteroidia bacterium]|nr:hypothetical protein [Bacteroidia bacterium]
MIRKSNIQDSASKGWWNNTSTPIKISMTGGSLLIFVSIIIEQAKKEWPKTQAKKD